MNLLKMFKKNNVNKVIAKPETKNKKKPLLTQNAKKSQKEYLANKLINQDLINYVHSTRIAINDFKIQIQKLEERSNRILTLISVNFY